MYGSCSRRGRLREGVLCLRGERRRCGARRRRAERAILDVSHRFLLRYAGALLLARPNPLTPTLHTNVLSDAANFIPTLNQSSAKALKEAKGPTPYTGKTAQQAGRRRVERVAALIGGQAEGDEEVLWRLRREHSS